MSKSNFGVFGLGVMGKSIALNIAKNKHKLSVYNRSIGEEVNVVNDFLNENKLLKNIYGFTKIKGFVASLSQPRQILLMVNAGKTVDIVLDSLVPYLDENDIIIDGGNSHYLETKRRSEALKEKGIHFIGCGISGGEEGAKKGPSMMPSGNEKAYKKVSNVLESISAKDDNGNSCCAYVGVEGSGHFVKMVHNGIEYAEMQLLSELYALMRKTMSYAAIVKTFRLWESNDLSSYLLAITCQILEKKEGEQYLVDLILDKAGNKGTGSWSSKAALELGISSSMMTSAVFARYVSSFKDMRTTLSKKLKTIEEPSVTLDLGALKQAYTFARIINHHQGFVVIEAASKEYNWNLNLSEIARVWTNGCIIKSDFMKTCVNIFQQNNNLLKNDMIFHEVSASENAIKTVLNYSLEQRVSLPCFYSAYNYWISMTSELLPANMIQAQRDFFGAHTYTRVDKPEIENFHTNW